MCLEVSLLAAQRGTAPASRPPRGQCGKGLTPRHPDSKVKRSRAQAQGLDFRKSRLIAQVFSARFTRRSSPGGRSRVLEGEREGGRYKEIPAVVHFSLMLVPDFLPFLSFFSTGNPELFAASVQYLFLLTFGKISHVIFNDANWLTSL